MASTHKTHDDEHLSPAFLDMMKRTSDILANMIEQKIDEISVIVNNKNTRFTKVDVINLRFALVKALSNNIPSKRMNLLTDILDEIDEKFKQYGK
jgi:hypothetical protein